MKHIYLLLLFTVLIILSGCAIIDTILGGGAIKEPIVRVESVNFGDISFESIDLLFNISIENPNNLGISLSSFDYELLLNDQSFVKGDQPEGMKLEAKASSNVRVPVSVAFRDVIESVQSVVQQDSSHYHFKSGFSFSLPVLGDVRIPVQKSGTLPVVKVPSFQVSSFKIENISFTGANAVLALHVKNPNCFSLGIQKLNYNFSVDGINVLKGVSERPIPINKEDESKIEIPVSISFIELGQAMYRILQGDQKAQFRFTGSAVFDSSLDFFQNIPLNFGQSGDLPLIR